MKRLIERGPDGVLYGGQLSGGERSGLDRIGESSKENSSMISSRSPPDATLEVITRVLQIYLFG